MSTKPILYYEMRVAFGMASLLPALLLPAYALLALAMRVLQGSMPTLETVIAVFEALLPLSAGLLAAHLMSLERDERVDVLRRSYPERTWRLPVVRIAGAVLMTFSVLLVSVIVLQFAMDGFALPEMLLPTLPPALFLIGVAMLANNLTGNYWSAAALIIAYWFLEYQTRGYYSGAFYLFQGTMPKPALDYDLNRGLLLTAAAGLYALNILYSIWRRRQGG